MCITVTWDCQYVQNSNMTVRSTCRTHTSDSEYVQNTECRNGTQNVTNSALLPSAHFRYVHYVVACTFSALSLFYCRYIFGTLSVLLPVHFRYAVCVTACTFSFHVCHTSMTWWKRRSREAVAKPVERLSNHNVTLSSKPVRQDCDRHKMFQSVDQNGHCIQARHSVALHIHQQCLLS